eukprot:TRINITY_DN18668_c4_g1_i1.p1 TRINITY_DN18668_c4_g1~~TRINITY_DN18668_c4_g1_i1.p1  ORF type:complete len:536 (+),score=123.42 TRINITY_DN18668_c4_g1_i1:56-1663(+)
MFSIFEALLWPFGIRRKRSKGKRRGPGEDEKDDDGDWEIDAAQCIGALGGAAFFCWAYGRYRSMQSSSQTMAIGNGDGPSAVPGPTRIPLSEFLKMLQGGLVTAVTYLADRPPAGALLLKAALPASTSTSPGTGSVAPVPIPQRMETLLLPGSHQAIFEELKSCKGLNFECSELASGGGVDDMSKLSLLVDLGGLVASIGALLYLLKSQGSFSGKHLEETAIDVSHRSAITFADVAGMETTKEELREVISYLRHPETFYALGARPPRGILLAGPSGTGKTLMARATAGEAGVPFLYASSASFVEIFVGQGAQRIRQFFEQARGCAPCIVFLDELDAVGAARSLSSSGGGGNQEYAQTLNQLLLELDGVESSGSSNIVVTMAATNRYDALDEALVRPGRLDRIVMVSLPNFVERVATLKIHASRLRTEDIDFELLAERTEGRSGADLANLLNEAALLAARRKSDAVRMTHVREVLSTPRPQQKLQQAREGWSEEGSGLPGNFPGNAEQMARIFQAVASAMLSGGDSSQFHDANSID